MKQTDAMVQHVGDCIARAKEGKSKIPPELLAIKGFSDKSIRHFLNNLGERPHTTYLDIGIWKGSTSCSMLCGNRSTVESAVLMDNWSQVFHEKSIEAVRDTFEVNVATFLSDYNWVRYNGVGCAVSQYSIFDLDCFSQEAADLRGLMPKINTYAYDGGHKMEEQRKALTFWNPVLDDSFILIVDDWKWERVRNGTHAGIKDLNYHVVQHWEMYDWWNGYSVFVIEKDGVA